MTTDNHAKKRTLVGLVVSDKMDKTIVVKVDSVKTHAKYGKQFIRSKRFKVHDEKNEFKVGETVTFVECRPYSKDKCWRATGKSGSGNPSNVPASIEEPVNH